MASTRRTVLTLCGGALTTALGGCLQFDSGTDDSGGQTREREPEPEPTPTPSGVEQTLDEEALEWISGTEYDGITDRTGQGTARVTVGPESAPLQFDPIILQVSAGTTVSWEWTGEGGGHSVVAEDGSFGTSGPSSGDGVTYSYTFTSSGTYRYYCAPHQEIGQVGLVIVE